MGIGDLDTDGKVARAAMCGCLLGRLRSSARVEPALRGTAKSIFPYCIRMWYRGSGPWEVRCRRPGTGAGKEEAEARGLPIYWSRTGARVEDGISFHLERTGSSYTACWQGRDHGR